MAIAPLGFIQGYGSLKRSGVVAQLRLLPNGSFEVVEYFPTILAVLGAGAALAILFVLWQLRP